MVEILKSQKCKDRILNDRFLCSKKRIFKGLQEWRCVDRSCRVIEKSAKNYINDLKPFSLTSAHNHEPEFDKLNIKYH